MKKSIFLTAAALLMGFTAFTGCGTDPNAPKTVEQRVAETEEKIRTSEEWLNSVKKKAEENHVPLDSMVHNDAKWMVDEEDGKHKKDAAAPAPDAKATTDVKTPAEAAKPADAKAPVSAAH